MTMVENGKKVTIEYTLTLEDGTVAGTNVGEDPLVYEHGVGQILPALERELEGLEVEAQKQVHLSPEEGYGPVDPEAFRTVEPGMIPEEARQVGAFLTAHDDAGNQQDVRVHEIQDDRIVLDFNHPLAGEALSFDIKVLGIE